MKKISAFSIVGIALILAIILAISVGSINLPIKDIVMGLIR